LALSGESKSDGKLAQNLVFAVTPRLVSYISCLSLLQEAFKIFPSYSVDTVQLVSGKIPFPNIAIDRLSSHPQLFGYFSQA